MLTILRRLVQPACLASCTRLCFSIDQSKYFVPKVPVSQFLGEKGIEFVEGGTTLRLKYCSFCTKPHYDDRTNLYVLNVNKESGVYFCHRCQSKGSWMDLKRAVLGIRNEEPSTASVQEPLAINQVEYFIYTSQMTNNRYAKVKEYVIGRGISEATIAKYQLGAGTETFYDASGNSVDVDVVYFPMYRYLNKKQKSERTLSEPEDIPILVYPDTKITKVKMRGIGPTGKSYMRQHPASAHSRGFFGLNTVISQEKEVIITEGQFDAMAVHQATGKAAISLPQGAGSLPDSLLPHLDAFQKIYLWMDNDVAGRLNEEKLAYKLGIKRTYLIKQTDQQCKDANDLLLKFGKEKTGQHIQQLLNKSQTLGDQNLLMFSSLRSKIKDRILRHTQYLGVRLSWFKFFNRKVKGIRMSELSILSGSTGCGKTTLLAQMTLDLCKQGINVLWGSFEIRNEILMTNMLTQFAGHNLAKGLNLFDYHADQFSQLPLHFMSFYGSSDVDSIINTIVYAIEKHNVSVVAIDTLQFLLSNQAEGFKKFELQDRVMAQLRRISIEHNVHIIVVIHPRKTEDSEDIGIHSIYGTSKATQEADNIWVIQNRESFKVFEVKKNRYDGQVGKVAIAYDRQSKNFFELRRVELESLYQHSQTVPEIVEARKASQENGESMDLEPNDDNEGGLLNAAPSKKKWKQ